MDRRQVYAVAIYTACRQGELRGLRVGDVDLDALQIVISKQVRDGKEKARTKGGRARTIQVVIVGASPMAALIYEIVLEASTEFHHSNLRLPLRAERVLSWFIMTPRAHGIHHSIVAQETNSNYSNFLILWDRLHRTLRLNVRQQDIIVGVPDYRDARELGLVSLLLMPFRRQRQRTATDGPTPSPRPIDQTTTDAPDLLP